MKIAQIIFLLFVLMACDNRDRHRKIIGGTFADESCKVNIPGGWTSVHITHSGMNYYILSAPKTPQNPNTSINIITESMHGFDLDEYKTKSMESLMREMPGVNMLEQGKIIANGIKGEWYSYLLPVKDDTASLICYIFPRDGVAYSMTAGTQKKDAARYRETFDDVAESLKFIE